MIILTILQPDLAFSRSGTDGNPPNGFGIYDMAVKVRIINRKDSNG